MEQTRPRGLVPAQRHAASLRAHGTEPAADQHASSAPRAPPQQAASARRPPPPPASARRRLARQQAAAGASARAHLHREQQHQRSAPQDHRGRVRHAAPAGDRPRASSPRDLLIP